MFITEVMVSGVVLRCIILKYVSNIISLLMSVGQSLETPLNITLSGLKALQTATSTMKHMVNIDSVNQN